MEEATMYLEMANAYLSGICEYDSASIFLFEDGDDGVDEETEKKNEELKEKATEAHKNFIQKIVEVIKDFIKKAIDFVKEKFGFGGGNNNEMARIEKAVEIIKKEDPELLNDVKVKMPDLRSFIKEQRKVVHEIKSAQSTGNYTKANELMEKFNVEFQKGDKVIEMSIYDAIDMMKESGEASKKDIADLKKLENDIGKVVDRTNVHNAKEDNGELNNHNKVANFFIKQFRLRNSQIVNGCANIGRGIVSTIDANKAKKVLEDKDKRGLNPETYDAVMTLINNSENGVVNFFVDNVTLKDAKKYKGSTDMTDVTKKIKDALIDVTAAKGELKTAKEKGDKRAIKAAERKVEAKQKELDILKAYAIKQSKELGIGLKRRNDLATVQNH